MPFLVAAVSAILGGASPISVLVTASAESEIDVRL